MTQENKLKCGDIKDEKSRTYTVYGIDSGVVYELVIKKPKKVFYGSGHSFHRVFDGKRTILAPAPGFIWNKDKIVGYCEMSWEPGNPKDACQW